MENITRIVDRLLSLDSFSKGAIEKALVTDFRRKSQVNRYVSMYIGEFKSGPFTSGEYTAPRPGSTSKVHRLTLVIRPGTLMTRQQVSTRYGSGIIGGITPNRGLHGTVTYQHEAEGKALFFTYDGSTSELREVTLHSVGAIEEDEGVEEPRPWWKLW